MTTGLQPGSQPRLPTARWRSWCATTDEALRLNKLKSPEAVVLDLNLGGESGLALIEPLLAANPGCRILVLTGYASIATAVDAVKWGHITIWQNLPMSTAFSRRSMSAPQTR